MQEHIIMFKEDTDYREDLRQLIRVIGLRPYNAMTAIKTGRFPLVLHEGEIGVIKKLDFVESVKPV